MDFYFYLFSSRIFFYWRCYSRSPASAESCCGGGHSCTAAAAARGGVAGQGAECRRMTESGLPAARVGRTSPGGLAGDGGCDRGLRAGVRRSLGAAVGCGAGLGDDIS